MTEAGPFVVVAAFCEQILREMDGVVSAIRIFDTVEVQPTAPQVEPVIALRFMLSIRCGTKTGELKVALALVSPSGVRAPQRLIQSAVDAPGLGTVWNIAVTLSIKETGLYWMEVSEDGAGVLTRVPLHVTIAQTQPSETPPSK